jgi:ADP-ribosylation factor-like protein 5B
LTTANVAGSKETVESGKPKRQKKNGKGIGGVVFKLVVASPTKAASLIVTRGVSPWYLPCRVPYINQPSSTPTETSQQIAMGFLFSKMWGMMASDRQYKTIVLGLNNAGKTSVLYSILLGKLVPTQPTLGSNVEEFTYRNLKFVAWDLGGQELLRHSWSLFYANTDAVIVVVDSADPSGFPVIRAEIGKLLQHPDLENACLLVFANKQDLEGALPPQEVATALGLAEVVTKHQWTIVGCSALKQTGLNEGLGWISDRLTTPSG